MTNLSGIGEVYISGRDDNEPVKKTKHSWEKDLPDKGHYGEGPKVVEIPISEVEEEPTELDRAKKEVESRTISEQKMINEEMVKQNNEECLARKEKDKIEAMQRAMPTVPPTKDSPEEERIAWFNKMDEAIGDFSHQAAWDFFKATGKKLAEFSGVEFRSLNTEEIARIRTCNSKSYEYLIKHNLIKPTSEKGPFLRD
jgi:hypothetical protein